MLLPNAKPHGLENLAERRVSALAERLSHTLGIACALAESGRHVDLSGIEDGVGMLCAQTLDLPTGHAHVMVPMLREVLSRVNRLTLLLEQSGTG
jgi:hypothetical protein